MHAAGFLKMKRNERLDFGDVLNARDRQRDDHRGVHAGEKIPVRIIDVGGAKGQSGPKIFPGLTENGDGLGGHVFAAVIADALDHAGGGGVSNGETLACAAGGSVKAGIAANRIGRGFEFRPLGNADNDFTRSHPFADIVVRLTDGFEFHARD